MSDQTTSWWWVRHAPVVGHDGRIYGSTDVDCDTSDGAAFCGLARRLPGDAHWLTSHLSRTSRTAVAIMAARGGASPEPMVEPAIGEQDFGAWHGLTHDELRRAPDGAYHKFWNAPAHHLPPGGESFVQVIERVGAAVGRITAEHAGRDIIAVSHGGPIRAALALALRLEPDAALAFQIGNLSITRIDHIASPGPGGNWRVVAVNHPPA